VERNSSLDRGQSLWFLSGGGDMGERIRAFDWSATPLGAPDDWPDALKTLTSMLLNSKQGMFLAWGPELTWLCNDAFVPILGDKHPDALGRPTAAIWAEAWPVIESLFDQVLAGESVRMEDFVVSLDRDGKREEARFDFSYNPVREGAGSVAGVYAVVMETTVKALRESEARFRFLDALGKETSNDLDADAILATTTRMVGEYLGIAVCAYADMDEDEDGFTIRGDWSAPGSPSIVGHYRLADFGKLAVKTLGAGLPLVVNDNIAELAPEEAATFQNIGIAATICMPLVKEGRLTALMAIHDKVPRVWSANELAVIREVTERSWAHVERVRAEAELRVSAKALSDLNATLEQRVQERTGQLMRAEDALRQSQKMEAVGQLTGGIAHDFNNLLAAVSGNLELLERRISEGRLVGLDRYINNAQGASRRAAALTQRLLAFARRQTLDPRPTDVNKLVSGMEDLIRRSVGPDVDVEIVGAIGLWAAKIDPSQLESSLLNLCINARDAMAPGGGRITIETANKWLDERATVERDLTPGQYLSVCVTDTGTGMPPEVIARAFEPFYTTKPIGEGTGLGLSMVYGFARQSGGQVRIYSEVGKGTTICLYLPRFHGAVDGEPSRDVATLGHGDGERVLVVDDEPAIRALVVEVLEDCGYVAIQAGDGPAGLRILDSDTRIDLLISDVGLPGGMNGRQVADAARVLRPDLKILFITGFAENAAVGNGHLAPGMELITKPFEMAALANKIRDLIDR
jgi:signal transduction histidine kinase